MWILQRKTRSLKHVTAKGYSAHTNPCASPSVPRHKQQNVHVKGKIWGIAVATEECLKKMYDEELKVLLNNAILGKSYAYRAHLQQP